MDARTVDRQHNRPPSDAEILREKLEGDEAAGLARKAAMLQMADDFEADHPTVEDDDASGVLAGLIRQISSTAKDMDGRRIAAKEPYLTASRTVDGFYKQLIDPLNDRASSLNKLQTAYQRAKADRARREAQEAARIAREEEERRRRDVERAERERLKAEREARRAREDEEAAAAARQRAADAERRAQEAREAEERARIEREAAARVAASSAADRSRVRGDYAVSSLRTVWTFDLIDITKVPPEFLDINTPLVNAAIRGKSGRRDIPGLHIYAVETAQNR